MASRIGKGEWFAVYAVVGTTDIIQWAADFTGVGGGVNEFADPIIAVILTAYFTLRGVPVITQPKRIISLFAADIAEQMTVSIAPAWIIDVWYIQRTIKQDDAKMQAAQEQAEFMQSGMQPPLNRGGMREPAPEINNGHIAPAPSKMLNLNGVRRPGP